MCTAMPRGAVVSLNTRSRALRAIQMEGNKFSVTLQRNHTGIYETGFGHLSASGGRKSQKEAVDGKKLLLKLKKKQI